ncbi:substrate-binding domain-containing protein [Crossiella equi]|uniref:substrate-binding domain-containing protein n=1 Tax=Crossiella equi TaxID=130796 RepID=UPI0027DC3964|nr:substrate-binding domain-containing protein [Crossiella equi]
MCPVRSPPGRSTRTPASVPGPGRRSSTPRASSATRPTRRRVRWHQAHQRDRAGALGAGDQGPGGPVLRRDRPRRVPAAVRAGQPDVDDAGGQPRGRAGHGAFPGGWARRRRAGLRRAPGRSVVDRAAPAAAADGLRRRRSRRQHLRPAPGRLRQPGRREAGGARAARHRTRVPQDVAVVGFDDHRGLAEATSPPLTTVHQDPREQVRQMVRTLQQLICGENLPPGRQVLPVSLVRRASA